MDLKTYNNKVKLKSFRNDEKWPRIPDRPRIITFVLSFMSFFTFSQQIRNALLHRLFWFSRLARSSQVSSVGMFSHPSLQQKLYSLKFWAKRRVNAFIKTYKAWWICYMLNKLTKFIHHVHVIQSRTFLSGRGYLVIYDWVESTI